MRSETQVPPAAARRTVLKAAGLGGLALLAPGGLAACGGDKAARGGATSGSMIGGLGYNVSTKFDPALATDVVTISVNNHLHEALVTLDPVTRSLSAGLATAMPSATGTTVPISLREARFHDGSPVKASDVVASFKHVQDPATNSPLAKYIDFLHDVRAKDDKTVEFSLAYPTNLLASRLALIRIVPEAALAKGAAAFEAHPIGCGPYQFVEFAPNDHVTLERFTGYTGARAGGPKQAVFRIMLDGSSRVAALRSKQVAMIDDLPYQDAATLGKASGVRTAMVQSVMQTIMMCNCAKAPFDDRRVRQALLWAIDRDAIAKNVFLGNCEIATSIVPQNHPAYSRPSTVYGYDPAKARELLAAAGHPNGLDVELQVNSLGWIAPQGTLIQQSAAKAGFRIKLNVGQTAGLFKNVAAGDYQAFLTPTDPSVFGYDGDAVLRYVYTGSFAKQFTYWQTPAAKQVASLLAEAQRSGNATQRELWARMQQIAADEAPAMTVHFKRQGTGWLPATAGAAFRPLPTPGMYVVSGNG